MTENFMDTLILVTTKMHSIYKPFLNTNLNTRLAVVTRTKGPSLKVLL